MIESDEPATEGHEPLAHIPVPSDRTVHILAAVVVLLVLLGVGLLGSRLYVLSENVRDQDRTNAAQDEALAEANQRLEEAGEDPVEVPEPGPAVQGDPGEDGAAGPRGLTGPAGPEGPAGEDGADGERGLRGFEGMGGTDGSVGPQGPQGPQGPPGEPGQAGQAGQAGPKGEPGESGPPGADGQQGPAGPAGAVNAGVYSCPDGQVLVGFTVTESGGVQLNCQQSVILPRQR